MTAKPPTPQGISALLRKAGLQRAEFKRGLVGRSGFQVRRGYHRTDIVVVQYRSLTHGGDGTRARQALERYAKAISAAGWNVENDPGTHVLRVTAAGE